MIKINWKNRFAAAAAATVIAASFLTSCSDIQASVTVPGASSAVTYKTDLALSPAGGNSSGTAEYYFPRAGQKPQTRLIQVINSAQKSLDMAIYSLTDQQIASAVTAAHKRGVTVRVISDKEQSADQYQKSLLRGFAKAGIPVKINSHSGLMHLKVTIADQSIATTGSFNYTKSAENKNDEVFVVLKDAKAAKDFDAEFDRMWKDTGDFTDFK